MNHIFASSCQMGLLALFAAPCFAQASADQRVCCESAAGCQQLSTTAKPQCLPGVGARGAPGPCGTLETFSSVRLKLHNFDMSPLVQVQRNLAGTYRLHLPTMTLINDWAVGDAPGISETGKAKLKVRRICTNGQAVEISASLFMVNFALTLNGSPAARRAGDTSIVGFDGMLGNERYFFSVVP
jgi:hypothetical protein